MFRKQNKVELMYEKEINNYGVNITCTASFEEAEKMCSDVSDFIDNKKLLQEHKFKIILGLREMMNNALNYGSQKAETAQISLKLIYNDKNFRMIMKDEGEGFDWRQQKDKDIDPLEVGGKGLYLLDKYFDAMYFNNKGNIITVEKDLGEKANN